MISEHSPLAHLHQKIDANFHPDYQWWRSPAFVYNLNDAANFAKINNITTKANLAGKKHALQANITKQLLAMMLSKSLATSTITRLDRFIPIKGDHFDQLLLQLNSLRNIAFHKDSLVPETAAHRRRVGRPWHNWTDQLMKIVSLEGL